MHVYYVLNRAGPHYVHSFFWSALLSSHSVTNTSAQNTTLRNNNTFSIDNSYYHHYDEKKHWKYSNRVKKIFGERQNVWTNSLYASVRYSVSLSLSTYMFCVSGFISFRRIMNIIYYSKPVVCHFPSYRIICTYVSLHYIENIYSSKPKSRPWGGKKCENLIISRGLLL